MPSLSRNQMIFLANAAARAFAVFPGRAEYVRVHGSLSGGGRAWRHEQLERVVGVASLNHCSADDFEKLAGHFHRARMVFLQDAAIAARVPAHGSPLTAHR